MINTKNTPIDTVLNRKKNIMNVLFNDINYESTKIKYTIPYVYKIKTNKIKTGNYIRNVNNLERKKSCNVFDEKDISVKDLTNSNSNYMILPNNEKRKNMYGNPVLIVDGKIDRYDKDILLYKYDAENEEEPDIDELIKIIEKEIDNMKDDMSYLMGMYNKFLKNEKTNEEYEKYKDGTITNKYIKDKYIYNDIDKPTGKIIDEYTEIIKADYL